ncbi:PREDICTED: uncharacterized protein LOC108370802 [Rhagoletis zephyria]|uniref:uncharacterized protein LOC108370802 n=1 Tax=Rhagoletis zephyria TaxID=28612 RepID=UPI000811744B|nr:PREDICTED: uncharacterized protein LOC108370802 [Rhagoletis zephyria]
MLSIDDEDHSSGDSASEEFSDSEFEDESSIDYAAFSARYMGEITDLLGTHSHVNCENALLLNQEMQQRLVEVRKRLQTLLQSVQLRYLANEQRLKMNLGKKQRGVGIRGAYLKGGTFFFKGNMFFKDLNCRNCPNNEDYEYRRNVEGEMFPMDFELCSRHVWSLLDKRAVVQAVKEQIIDYLADRKFRDKNNKSKKLELEIKVHTEKVASLLAQVDDKFQIDWAQVSAHNLNYRHSPSSCKAMWQVYLHPTLKRSSWTEVEKRRLLQAARKHNYQNWELIATAVPKRSDYQCFIQYHTSVCYTDTQRYGRWDKRDDKKLLEVIEKKTTNGIVEWNAVAPYFPHKSKKALHQRYLYYLHPKISHEPFTAEEDLILLAAVEEYGEKFALFPRTLFPNRSITQLRMRYRNTLQTRHKLAPWTVEDDKKLMECISEHGTSAWLRCAEVLGNHNRISCRTRFVTIQKFFVKNPEATIEDIPRKKTCIMKNSVITTQNWVEKVAELRDNPDAVLIPERKIYAKQKGKSKAKRNKCLKGEEELKCEIQKEKEELVEDSKAQIIAPKEESGTETPAPEEEETIPNASFPECDTQTPLGIKKKKVRYVERLRAVELQLYNFFKYAYNFRLGTDVCNKPPNVFLRTVASSLGFRPDPTRPYVTDTLLSKYIGRRCKFYLSTAREGEVLSHAFGATLPPSWPTAMAFRALCVQSSQVQLEDAKNDEHNEESKHCEIDMNAAVQSFRKRMRTLLYQTALLSRLQPTRFPELMQSIPSEHTTTDLAIMDDIREETTSSVYEISTENSLFDLTRVKTEYSETPEFLPNHESFPVIDGNLMETSDNTPKAEVFDKQKRIERPEELQFLGEEELRTTPDTLVLSENITTLCKASPSHSSAEQMVLFEVTYIDDDPTTTTFQPVSDSHCIEDGQQYHSGEHSTAIENVPKNCGAQLLNVAEKRKLGLTPSTEEEPAQKRIYIKSRCNSDDYKSEDIKTEF